MRNLYQDEDKMKPGLLVALIAVFVIAILSEGAVGGRGGGRRGGGRFRFWRRGPGGGLGSHCFGRYLCPHGPGSPVCIDTCRICDGFDDCPNGEDEQNCPVPATEFCWSGCCTTRAHDCQDILAGGQNISGVYEVCPYGLASCTNAYCDFDTDGGGWTVFQCRQDGSVDFFRDWDGYKNGFGSASGEYWLGNKYIHALVSTGTWELRIDLEDFENNTRFAKYSSFYLSGAEDKYRLSTGMYSGDAGDSLTYHSGNPFSTKDFGPKTSCANSYQGAWWYLACHRSNLNGQYLGGVHASYADGVNWLDWKGYYYSLKTSKMMMRRL